MFTIIYSVYPTMFCLGSLHPRLALYALYTPYICYYIYYTIYTIYVPYLSP